MSKDHLRGPDGRLPLTELTKEQRAVLAELRQREWTTTRQLLETVSHRYSARINELRHDFGFVIDREPVPGSRNWQYRIKVDVERRSSAPDPQPNRPGTGKAPARADASLGVEAAGRHAASPGPGFPGSAADDQPVEDRLFDPPAPAPRPHYTTDLEDEAA